MAIPLVPFRWRTIQFDGLHMRTFWTQSISIMSLQLMRSDSRGLTKPRNNVSSRQFFASSCFSDRLSKDVERLRQELENKFIELGPATVIGCKFAYLPELERWAD